MKGKVLFYSLVSVIVLVSGYALYRLSFSGASSSKSKAAQAATAKKFPGMKLSQAVDKQESIWQDPRLKKNHVSEADLKRNAEIENNLSVLVKLYDQGLDEDFLARLNDLIADHPDAVEYIALKGDYYYNEGNWPEAEKAVEDMLKLDPENIFARTSLGELQAIQGRYDEALRSMDQVLQKDVGNIDALYGYMSIADMKGESQLGIQRVEKAYQDNRQNGNVALAYSDVLQASNQMERRHTVLQEAMRTDPNNPGPFRYSALDAQLRGNHKDAIHLAEQAYAKDGNVETQVQSLDILWQSALYEKDYDRAESALTKLHDLNPQDEAIQYQIQQIKEARRRNK